MATIQGVKSALNERVTRCTASEAEAILACVLSALTHEKTPWHGQSRDKTGQAGAIEITPEAVAAAVTMFRQWEEDYCGPEDSPAPDFAARDLVLRILRVTRPPTL